LPDRAPSNHGINNSVEFAKTATACYREVMAIPSTRRDMKALKRLINQADLVLNTIPTPHPSVASARESLNAAIRLTDSIMLVNPAADLGAKGGQVTAQRGADYFRELAAKRKTHAGGRPRKPK
jgi:hypothetical protein